MDISHIIQQCELFQKWERFYNNDMLWAHGHLPSPLRWATLNTECKNFTPQTWIAWHNDNVLKNILVDIKTIFNNAETAECFLHDIDFQIYTKKLTLEEKISYNLLHCEPISLDNVVSGLFSRRLPHETNTIMLEHLDVLEENMHDFILPHLPNFAFLTNRNSLWTFNGNNTDMRLIPYLTVYGNYNSIDPFIHNVRRTGMSAFDTLSNNGLKIFLANINARQSYQIESAISCLLDDKPELLTIPSIICKNPHLFHGQESYYIEKCAPFLNETSTHKVALEYLETLINASEEIPLSFIQLSLKNHDFMLMACKIAKNKKIITYNKNNKEQKWLSYCEEKLDLPQKYLVSQYDLMKNIDDQFWNFSILKDNNFLEINIL